MNGTVDKYDGIELGAFHCDSASLYIAHFGGSNQSFPLDCETVSNNKTIIVSKMSYFIPITYCTLELH